MSICPQIFSTTAQPINFTLGRCMAEDPRKCSVDRSWTGERFCKHKYQRQRNRPVPNRHVSKRAQDYCMHICMQLCMHVPYVWLSCLPIGFTQSSLEAQQSARQVFNGHSTSNITSEKRSIYQDASFMAPQRQFVLQFGQFTSLGPIRIWQHRRHFLAVHANDYCKDVTLKGNHQPFKSFWWGFKIKAKHLISWDYGL